MPICRDDATLLATTKRGAELITTEYMLVGKDFGLTLSIPEMKVMAVEREVTVEQLCVGEEEIESVNEFPYLGSQIESSGRHRKADCTGFQGLWRT